MIYHKFLKNIITLKCGDAGIRTLETLLGFTHFPGVRLRPLGHISISENIVFLYQNTRILG